MLENEDDKWKLISLDERRPHGLAPRFLQRWVKSAYFTTVIMFLILLDALIAASTSAKRGSCNTKIREDVGRICSCEDMKGWRYWVQVCIYAKL